MERPVAEVAVARASVRRRARERRLSAIEERLGAGTVLALVAMGLAVVVVANDFTALSVALPSIQRDFHADVTTVQWVINGYALVFGVLIVTGGRLADIFGRRRIFVAGASIFALFSVVGGLAPNVAWLLATRAVMGVGGALMWPAILGMTYEILPKAKAGLAGGLILGAAGLGNAVGPLVGGSLTDALSWRWIFFVNLPVSAAAIAVTLAAVHVPEPRAASRRIDYPGVAALSFGLLALLLALDQGSDAGWTDPRILGLFAGSVVLLSAFAFVERRMGTAALVPRNVLANRGFAAAALSVLMMSAIFFSALLYLPQFMEKALAYSAVRAGAGLLPMMGTFAAVSFVAGPLYGRLGPKAIVSLGAAFLAAGIFLLSLVEPSSGYPSLILGMVVLGVGVGLFYSSITTAGVTALDPSEASLAGAIVYMCQIAGGSIGLGINTAIVATHASIADGVEVAFKVDAALAVAGLLIALMFVGGRVDRERLAALRWHHRAHA
jgi:EmrB/QacA subfamily drug resistance transporter